MEIGKKLLEAIKKYRYPILVLVAGLMLMALPSGREKTTEAVKVEATQPQPIGIAKDLEEILSQIKGVGRVQVLLTQAAGERYQFQQDESTERSDTVLVTDSDRNQSPILTQVLPPEYLGAVIVCQGASSPEVKLAVVEAVSKATGLTADKISVLKMK